MGLKEILERENLSLKDLQEFQEEYDKRFVDEKFMGFEKVRHTTLHMGKLLGKLSNYCEKMEHGENIGTKQILNEVIPDLLVYAMWLSKESGANPEKAYFNRIIGNIKKMYWNKTSIGEIEELKDIFKEKYNQ